MAKNLKIDEFEYVKKLVDIEENLIIVKLANLKFSIQGG
jgi:hypothetical protein